MKAISLKPGTTDVRIVTAQEPEITAPDEIKMKVLQVGICGTDREEASGGRADAPKHDSRLIIGHEMLGEVFETGENVTRAKKGNLGVFTVRRGCGKCEACKNNRSDMCYTGDYTERGIKEADGYQCEYVVDKEQYFVRVPDQLQEIAVLTEPMSVASKGIEEALLLQRSRILDFEKGKNWIDGRKALIAGVGAVGLLAAFALRLRGAQVYGLDIVDEKSKRPQMLQEIGGKYIDGRKVKTLNIDDEIGEFDFIFEAAGFAELQIELIDVLGVNGIYVSTGIPGGNKPLTINGSDLMRQLVLKNQLLLGSVNASMEHFKTAVADLEAAQKKWPETLGKMITEKFAFTDFEKALGKQSADEIKVVVKWADIST